MIFMLRVKLQCPSNGVTRKVSLIANLCHIRGESENAGNIVCANGILLKFEPQQISCVHYVALAKRGYLEERVRPMGFICISLGSMFAYLICYLIECINFVLCLNI